jgi:hypothetical protein
MILIPFLQKKEKTEPGGGNGDTPVNDKKIDFAKKLAAEDLEGQAAKKGRDFNFLDGVEDVENTVIPQEASSSLSMNEEAKPLVSEPESSEKISKDDQEESGDEEEAKENWFERLKKVKIGGSGAASIKAEKNALEVNLIKGEIVKFFDWQKALLVLIIAVFSSFTILSVSYWGISWWGSSRQYVQNRDFLQEYYRIDKEISDLQSKLSEISQLKDKIGMTSYLLDRHIYWTNFFSFLEDNILSNVYFANFSGNIDGDYSFSATTDSLDVIDAQIKKFLANKYVKKAEVGAGTVGGDKEKQVVTFSLSLSVDPQIFLK